MANLFLHYVFDVWMTRRHPDLPWCRYADDGLVHCRTEAEAVAITAALAARFAECQLEMHPDKTKIVYCKDGKRRSSYSEYEVRLPRLIDICVAMPRHKDILVSKAHGDAPEHERVMVAIKDAFAVAKAPDRGCRARNARLGQVA